MGIVYHGSPNHGIKVLKTNPNATHGRYCYATKNKIAAYIFASRCGDDQVRTIESDGFGGFVLTERIPHAFDYIYFNSASIYELSDETFNIKTSWGDEVLSEVDVPVLKETYIENIGSIIDKLEEEGKLTIYRYPNRHDGIPIDDHDLIDKEVNYAIRTGKKVTNECFARCVFLHPHLVPKVNEILRTVGENEFTEDDILFLIDMYKKRSKENPLGEYYIESALEQIKEVYPNLLNEKTR